MNESTEGPDELPPPTDYGTAPNWRRFETIAANTNDGVLITEALPIDAPGPRIVYVNQAFERLTGYTFAEMVGSSPRIFQGPATDRATLDRIRQALIHHQAITEDVLNVRKDGSAVWLEMTISPITDNTGLVTHFFSVQRDVTARRQAEARLNHELVIHRQAAQLSADYFRAVWQISADAMALSDSEGRIIEANPAYYQLYGYRPDEVIGRSFAVIFPAERRQEVLAQYKVIFQSGNTIEEYESVVRRADGMQRIVEARIDFIYEHGQRVAMLSTIRDITQRKQNEEILQQQLAYGQALSACSQVLLKTQDHQYESHELLLNEALGHLLVGAQVRRVGLFENFVDAQNGLCSRLIAEATAGDTPSRLQNHEMEKIPWWLSPPHICQQLAQGKHAQFLLTELLPSAINPVNDIAAYLLVPIFIDGVWWGYVAFGDGTVERQWREQELLLLHTAAEMLSGVLKRWQAEAKLQQAHDTLEQQVIERTLLLTRTIGDLKHEIGERWRAETSLRASREQLRKLAARQEALREAERTHIARAVHDELGQALTALKLDVAWLLRHTAPDGTPIGPKLVAMGQLITETIRVVQRVARELRPGILDDLGLGDAIDWQLREFAERTGIQFDFVDQTNAAHALESERATVVFRIFQEALTNIARHANASIIQVVLRQDSRWLSLSVRDDGVGISPEQLNSTTAYGLIGMRERVIALAGMLSIDGKPGQGTTLEVILPIAGETDDPYRSGR